MCLIGLRLTIEPGPELLIAANRDEFHIRPTTPAHWWPGQAIFAGRDDSAGGTWLGVSASGRFATVTNVREMQNTQAPQSRGEIPVAFLLGTSPAQQWCEQLLKRGDQYAGFNLLAWDGDQLWWCSNRDPKAVQVQPGIHALSNHRLDTPWPKVTRLRERMSKLSRQAQLTTLIELLGDRSRPPGNLPDTGVGSDKEALLAPMFIQSATYGTRCSTALRVGSAGFEMIEVSYDALGNEMARRDSNGQTLPGC